MMSWNSSLLADLARRRMPAGSTVREMVVATRSREPKEVDTLRTVVTKSRSSLLRLSSVLSWHQLLMRQKEIATQACGAPTEQCRCPALVQLTEIPQSSMALTG